MPLGPLRRDMAAVSYEGWPRWVAWSQAGLMLMLVAAVGSDPAVSNRLALVAATLVAVSGWLVLPFRCVLPHWLHASLTLGILGVVNAAPERLGFETPDGHVQITLLVVVLLAGEAMSHWRLSLAVLVVVSAALISSPLVSAHKEAPEIWVGAALLAGVVGLLIRALLSTVLDLEATQEELSRRAAAEERQRIAREVHDVIAHSLTVTMLHLTAARLAVGRGDPAAATEALEEAEAAGRRSLTEVRRTVGLLRTQGDSSTGLEAPTAVAADVATLVDEYRSAGVSVDLDVAGDLTSVPSGVGIAVYRTVQEALANVARHRPGATALVSVAVDDHVRVQVRSQGGRVAHAPGVGAGLLGMRERAAAVGGRCEAGPVDDGWLIDVELPRQLLNVEVGQ